MKNVYKSKFPKAPKAVKQDNKRLAAFILLGFFIFTAIGSILGIIAFARTSKEDSAFNVVSANADVVDDFVTQQKVNLVDYMYGQPFTFNTNNFEPGFDDELNQYYLDCYLTDRSMYHSGYEPFILMKDLYEDVNNDMNANYFFAFAIHLSSSSLADFPSFRVICYNSSNYSVIQTYSFARQMVDENGFCVYTCRFGYQDTPNFIYRLDMSIPYNPSFIYDFLSLESVQIKDMAVNYTGYSYTYEELQKIYLDSLNGSPAYDEGYDDGYSAAIDVMNSSLNGLFSVGQAFLDVGISSDGGEPFSLSNLFVTKTDYTVNMTKTIRTNIDSAGINPGPYRNSLTYFCFRNFPSDVILLDSYSIVITSNIPISSDDGPVSTVDLWTTRTVYEATVTRINENQFLYFFDLSSMRDDEKLDEIRFISSLYALAYYPDRELSISNGDYAYVLGVDYGYWQAYEQFRNEFQQQLNQEYQKGFNQGKVDGYSNGYNEGVEAANNYSFTSLIGAVVDVPIKTFTSLFNFEILGVNLANFFYALFTCCVVLAIVKLLI